MPLYHMSSKKSTQRSRYYAFVVYPESAPENWRDILQQTGLEFAISPLHDKDLNADDEEKKAHWHVIAVWGNTTTYATAKRISDSVNAPIPQALSSLKGYYRYLTHKDNPEKHQYDESDISTLNGFNISNYEDLTRHEVNKLKKRIQELVRQSGITEYSVLMDVLLDSDMHAEWDVASNHTIFFNSYLKSRRYTKDER